MKRVLRKNWLLWRRKNCELLIKNKYYYIVPSNWYCENNIVRYNRAVKERIKNKLKDSKKSSQSKLKVEDDKVKKEETNEDKEEEEYYLGKDRDEERKKKAYVLLNTDLYSFKVEQNRSNY